MNLIQFVREMAEAKRYLEGLPDDTEWSVDHLADLEAIRDAALSLSREVESMLVMFRGGESA